MRWIIAHVPGVQAFRRRFVYHYGEFLTLMIRHPRTWGRIGALRSAHVHALPAARSRGAAQGLARLHLRLQAGAVQLALPAGARGAERGARHRRVTGLTERGIVTADGREREVDCVIFGTGFRTTEFMFPMEVSGSEGRTLREAWSGGAHAHLGVTVPGFPSLFVMYGPNTNTSGGSIILYEETQAAYIRQALEHVERRRRGGDRGPCRRSRRRATGRCSSGSPGRRGPQCDSWYRTEGGRVVANWPGYMREYEARLRMFEPAEFRLVGAPAREPDPV